MSNDAAEGCYCSLIALGNPDAVITPHGLSLMGTNAVYHMAFLIMGSLKKHPEMFLQ